MPEYREIAPPPDLSASVECFWTGRQDGIAAVSRVMPDGCADILLTRHAGKLRLEAVGPMTRYADFTQPPGQVLVGVRFRPGAWRPLFNIPAERLTDRIVPLEDLWGKRARPLREHLSDARTLDQFARILSPQPPEPLPVLRAIAWMEHRRGCVSMDHLARLCGMSPRQLRRSFIEQTGMGPKFLARVLRFRHAAARAPYANGDFAGLAVECGYYDQAHLIRDFREFAGKTPAGYAAGRFIQSAASLSAVASYNEQPRKHPAD
jgi:AraC-like DNA-binding protein